MVPSAGQAVKALRTILDEIVDGTGEAGGWLLNPGDVGLLNSLDRLTAEQASLLPPYGTASIAAHVEHVRYGLSLLNQAGLGADPWANADWSAAWRRVQVTEDEWARLRAELRHETDRLRESADHLTEVGEFELTATLGTAAHLAYHLGAIRQIHAATRGPRADSPA
jgi:hypothetical protein